MTQDQANAADDELAAATAPADDAVTAAPEPDAELAAATAPSSEEEKAVLSDAEVGALLEGVADGAVSTGDGMREPGEVNDYQFADSAHVSSYCPVALVKLYNRLSRRIKSGLHDLLREELTVELDSLRRVRYDEYLAGLSEPISLNIVSTPALPGKALIVLEASLISLMVDRYYGGSPDETAATIARALTPAELRMADKCVGMILEQLKDAWSSVTEVDLRPEGVESNPRLVTIADSSQGMLVARFSVTVGASVSECHLVMPLDMLAPLRAMLAASGQGRLASRSLFMSGVRDHLRNVDVELVGTLCELTLPLRQIVAMAPGDIIPVDLPPQAVLKVDDADVLFGRFGKSRGINALCVDRREAHPTTNSKEVS